MGLHYADLASATLEALRTGGVFPAHPLALDAERRLDRQIADLEQELADMEPGSEAHSDNLRRLIALQQEKRSSSRL